MFILSLFVLPLFITLTEMWHSDILLEFEPLEVNPRSLTFDIPPNNVCSSIDLVYLWVNGSDPAIPRAIAEMTNKPYVERGRLRDIPTLRYSMRAAATFAPFLRNIVLVTNGQVPVWLNTSHPRVRVVTHKEIFEKEDALPTFNSNAIEAQLPRIPGIAPCWFYQNDDFSFGRPVKISDWIDLESGKQHLAFDSWRAPEVSLMRKNIWHASVGYSNHLINKFYHPDTDADATPTSPTNHRHNYEGHNTRLFQQRYLDMIYSRWRDEFIRTTYSRFRQRNDTALPFMYNNVVLEEGGGSPSRKLRNGFTYSSFKPSARSVAATLRGFMRDEPISWCLNDGAGVIDTPKKEKDYNDAVQTLETIMSRRFPYPAEFELHEPGQQTIPRTLAEYAELERKKKEAEPEAGVLGAEALNTGEEKKPTAAHILSPIFRAIICVWLLAMLYWLYKILQSCFINPDHERSSKYGRQSKIHDV